MSDRYRYRAWIPCEVKFADSVCVFHDGSIKAGLHTCEDYEIVFRDDEVILMQCTGLKDKNGVLIYEGDILKTEYKNHVAIYDDEVWPSLDGYENGDYYVGDFPQCHQWDRFEVIGNIHEHPELVED